MAAYCGIDPSAVFWCDRGTRKPVIAVWLAECNISGFETSELKTLANRHGAKFYASKLHPHEQERREQVRRNRRGTVTARHLREFRLAAWHRQKGRCMWCRGTVRPDAATLEHIVPRSEGGGSDAANLGMACGPCNWHRDRTPKILSFLRLLRHRVYSFAA